MKDEKPLQHHVIEAGIEWGIIYWTGTGYQLTDEFVKTCKLIDITNTYEQLKYNEIMDFIELNPDFGPDEIEQTTIAAIVLTHMFRLDSKIETLLHPSIEDAVVCAINMYSVLQKRESL
jgi:hypothetical protein